MAVPLADQLRLRSILAFDLQPRIQWAYDLEQDIALLSGGGLTSWGLVATAEYVFAGDPNGQVTAVQGGDLLIDTDTPALWIADAAGTAWTNVTAAGGGAVLSVNTQTGAVVLDAADIAIVDAGNDFTATEVEGALAELQSDHEADATALSDHIADTSAAHAASAISADSTALVGTGTDVQAVLEELDNAIVADETALANHLADTSDAHDASAISILDTANDFTATDVEGALAELQTADEADEAALAAHLADTSAAHAASAVSVDSTTLVGTGTDVQAVLEELDNGIADHLADATDAHDASAISFTAYGDNVATDVQGALESIEDRLGGTAFLDDLDVAVELRDHFLGGGLTDGIIGELGWSLAVGATGSIVALTSIIDGTCGRVNPATGIDAGGYAEIQLRSGSTASVFMHGAPPFAYEWKVRLAALPTAAQDFTVSVGFCDKSTTADPTSGFWFLVQPFATDSTPTWQCVIADPGTGTTTQDSGVAVAAATDYKLRVVCDGAGTAYFYIDGVLVHTQTGSTNFPDTTVDSYAPTLKIRKTAGTTGRTVQGDYFGMRYEYT